MLVCVKHVGACDRNPAAISLIVLTLVLCDVELVVQVVQQGVGALLTQWVVHVCLARHDVKQVAGHL